MPEEDNISVLRVHGHGEVEVALVVSFLNDLENAYNSIAYFETLSARLERDFRYLDEYRLFIDRRARMFGLNSFLDYNEENTNFNKEAIAASNTEPLVLERVKLTSPGYWDFIGKLNPLEVLRQYLNDRHERRKDKNYKEDAEARKLALQNLIRENEAISGRIKICREMGATDADLAPTLKALVAQPLSKLNRYQDLSVIETTGIMRNGADHKEKV